MNITKVQVHLAEKGNIKAFCDIIIDEEFIVRGITVRENDNGNLYIRMPYRKDGTGNFRDVAHPIRENCRLNIEGVILDAFEEAEARYYEKIG